MEISETTKATKKVKQTKQVKQAKQPLIVEAPVETPIETQVEAPVETPQPSEIRLVDISIENENIALNVMVGFLNVAHKRGVFTIDESAKIWECISKFQKR